jgi:hypothetical protein
MTGGAVDTEAELDPQLTAKRQRKAAISLFIGISDLFRVSKTRFHVGDLFLFSAS